MIWHKYLDRKDRQVIMKKPQRGVRGALIVYPRASVHRVFHWNTLITYKHFCWFQISISTWADRWPQFTIIKSIKNYKSCWQSPRVKLFLNYWHSVQSGCIFKIHWLIVKMCKIEKKKHKKCYITFQTVILPHRYKNCIYTAV